MIAAPMGTSTMKPLTLQNSSGPYATLPAPGGTSTAPRLSAPQWISSATRQPTPAAPVAPPRQPLSAPAAAPSGAASPNLTSAIAPVQFKPAVLNAPQAPLAPPPQTPAPQAAAPAAAAGTVPAGTTAVSGSEVPYHVGAGPSDATNSMLSKLATEAGRQLDQPTVWDDPLAKQIKDAQTTGINSDYDVAGQHLDASLADRGINYSTIAGGDIMDLNKARAGALTSVDADIAQQRANALAAGRSSAFGNANSVLGSQNAVDQQTRTNQIGERGYTDTLRNKAQTDAQAADDRYQQILNQAYGYGTSGAGNSALGSAAGIYGSQAGQYSDSQQQDQGGLATLADLAAQFFGPSK